ncbi:MAG: HEPN domain-containing protein [Candidatus Stahlbacteria bacterium]|nr:HEPN domain-containing protein [Candidatus Stahlbacteria bacterium]
MGKDKFKLPKEWFNQANYDLQTAEAMFKTGRYIYTVFMCHLSIEKALKGLYAKNFQKSPPKTHDLNYLSKEINLMFSEELKIFMDNLNDLSIPTRYPDELDKLLTQYKKDRTEKVLNQTKVLLLWLKEKL